MRVIITLIILGVSLTSCKQELSIVGHWRPADAVKSVKEAGSDSLQFRDLLLNADSTFISVGLQRQPKQIEGWHNGGTQKGDWKFVNGILSLYIKGSSHPLNFKVLKLTKQEIRMESNFMDSVEMRLIKIKDFG